MRIKFSRHAKRRAKLYNISESIITNILTNMNLQQGKHKIIRDVAGFKHPLKIVVSVKSDIITIITNYPLKRGRRK